jgi:hypothetical protein
VLIRKRLVGGVLHLLSVNLEKTLVDLGGGGSKSGGSDELLH